MNIYKTITFLILFVIAQMCFADINNEEDQTVIHLQSPHFKYGVLTTDKGGVLENKNIRIQAQKIKYTRKVENNKLHETIDAKENLLVEKQGQRLKGNRIKYDFDANSGFIENGTISFKNWFVGGDKIELHEDNSYTITNGYITTCPSTNNSWRLYSKKIEISKNKILKTKSVKVKIGKIPILVLPSFRTNLNSIQQDVPVSMHFNFGGYKGSRIGINYRILEKDNLKATLFLNYHFKKGPGGGLATDYKNEEKNIKFTTTNYLAKDKNLMRPNKNTRYRFSGKYKQIVNRGKTTIVAQYDKLSDSTLPNDMFLKNDFDIQSSKTTKLQIDHQEDLWKASFLTDVRINSYETMNQHLPSIEGSLKPISLGSSGIIMDNRGKLSYLNFVYTKYHESPPDFHSTRCEFKNETYKALHLKNFIVTPNVGFTGIHYNNTPQKKQISLGQAKTGIDIKTMLYKNYDDKKHTITPYASYNNFLTPTEQPNKHYLFNIDDGIAKLEYLRLGLRSFLSKQTDNKIEPILSSDIYTYSFYNSKNFHKIISKMGCSLQWYLTQKMLIGGEIIYNTEHGQLDRINIRTDYTHNENLAFGIEFRMRNTRDWRKSNYDNFTLNSYQNSSALLKSNLSDRRNTIIARAFYRMTPDWSFLLESRNGWNRKNEPSYREIMLGIIKKLQGKWRLKINLQHTELENSISLGLSLGR